MRIRAALAGAIMALVKHNCRGVYHAANSGFCTWYEFAKEIFSIKGINIAINPVSGDYFKRDAKRPAHSILLNTKLSPMRPWQEALREYLLNFQ